MPCRSTMNSLQYYTWGCSIPAWIFADPPPVDGYCRGFYASYWNAFSSHIYVFRNYLIGWRGARRRRTRRSGWRTRQSRGTTTTNNPSTGNYMSVDRLIFFIFILEKLNLPRLCIVSEFFVHERDNDSCIGERNESNEKNENKHTLQCVNEFLDILTCRSFNTLFLY